MSFRFLLFAAILTLGACSSMPRPNAVMSRTETADAAQAGLMKAYTVGVGDQLNVSVWQNPQLSTNVTVLPDGTISVPLVGSLKAAGDTTDELAKKITAVLGSYIRQPKVTVSVVSAASSEYLQRVRITGAVNAPLSLTYRRGITVLDLVLQAKGLTAYANPNKSLLYRKENGKLKVYPVYLDDILTKGKLDTNYTLLPGDILTIPEKSF